MRRALPILMLLGFAALAAPAVAQTGDAALQAAIDSIVTATLAADGTPGMSVAVVHHGDTIVMKGYGLADVEQNVPVTDETVFRIGSLTKQFTSAAVMKLVEQGRIRLDATIADYLPSYPQPGRNVTIHQLLNHTSGIPSYTGMGERFWDRSRLDLTHEDMVEMFGHDTLDFAPGSEWSYNNSGYYLLGMIIEKVTGESYEDHLVRVEWQPLGLTQTYYCDEADLIPHRAEGYAVEDSVLMNDEPLSMNVPGAAGALCSTARDLVHWNAALVAGDVVSPASYAKMIAPTTLSDGSVHQYGYGLAPGMSGDHPVIQHSGGINGFSAFMAWYPADTLTVVVLANGPTNTTDVSATIARRVLGLPAPPEDVAEEVQLPGEQRALYLGNYDLAPAMPLQVRIFVQNDQLMAQATGQSAFPLYFQGGHRFVGPPAVGIAIEFVVENDQATAFTLFQGGAELRATRY